MTRYVVRQVAEKTVNDWLDYLGCATSEEFTAEELEKLRQLIQHTLDKYGHGHAEACGCHRRSPTTCPVNLGQPCAHDYWNDPRCHAVVANARAIACLPELVEAARNIVGAHSQEALGETFINHLRRILARIDNGE